MPPTAGRTHVTDARRAARASTTCSSSRRERRAHEQRRCRLAARASTSRPTSRWSTDAESRAAAARLLRGLDARAPPTRARTPAGGTTPRSWRRSCGCRHEAARLLGVRQLRRVCARHAHGAHASRRCWTSCASWRARRAPRRAAEFAELEAFAGRKLEAWDVGFYAERLQRERYSVSQEELRPYFPLPRVLAGAVRGRREAVRRAHPRAQRRAGVASGRALLRDRRAPRGAPLGSFYLDAYARPNKRSGAWMDECVGRKRLATGSRAAGGLPGVQFLPPGERAPGAAHARRRGDAVPRVRARPASPAHARRLPEHRRHQRRGLGRGGAAEPVPGELRLASARCCSRISGHFAQRRAAAGRDSRRG